MTDNAILMEYWRNRATDRAPDVAGRMLFIRGERTFSVAYGARAYETASGERVVSAYGCRHDGARGMVLTGVRLLLLPWQIDSIGDMVAIGDMAHDGAWVADAVRDEIEPDRAGGAS